MSVPTGYAVFFKVQFVFFSPTSALFLAFLKLMIWSRTDLHKSEEAFMFYS